MKLAERVAIVTGGALGIGKAIATACAREGAKIVLCDIAVSALAAAADRDQSEDRGEPDDGSHYYHHWLAALERLVTSRGLLDRAALE